VSKLTACQFANQTLSIQTLHFAFLDFGILHFGFFAFWVFCFLGWVDFATRGGNDRDPETHHPCVCNRGRGADLFFENPEPILMTIGCLSPRRGAGWVGGWLSVWLVWPLPAPSPAFSALPAPPLPPPSSRFTQLSPRRDPPQSILYDPSAVNASLSRHKTLPLCVSTGPHSLLSPRFARSNTKGLDLASTHSVISSRSKPLLLLHPQ
jgi:hypothetical protein